MDLSSFPEDVTFYIEIGEYWRVERINQSFYQLTPKINDKDEEIKKIALKIFEEAIPIWEEERKIKFSEDMHKDYEDQLIQDFKNIKDYYENETE
jgi:hypothetical protein